MMVNINIDICIFEITLDMEYVQEARSLLVASYVHNVAIFNCSCFPKY